MLDVEPIGIRRQLLDQCDQQPWADSSASVVRMDVQLVDNALRTATAPLTDTHQPPVVLSHDNLAGVDPCGDLTSVPPVAHLRGGGGRTDKRRVVRADVCLAEATDAGDVVGRGHAHDRLSRTRPRHAVENVKRVQSEGNENQAKARSGTITRRPPPCSSAHESGSGA